MKPLSREHAHQKQPESAANAGASGQHPPRYRSRVPCVDGRPEQVVALIGAKSPKAPPGRNYLNSKPVGSDSETQPSDIQGLCTVRAKFRCPLFCKF